MEEGRPLDTLDSTLRKEKGSYSSHGTGTVPCLVYNRSHGPPPRASPRRGDSETRGEQRESSRLWVPWRVTQVLHVCFLRCKPGVWSGPEERADCLCHSACCLSVTEQERYVRGGSMPFVFPSPCQGFHLWDCTCFSFKNKTTVEVLKEIRNAPLIVNNCFMYLATGPTWSEGSRGQNVEPIRMTLKPPLFSPEGREQTHRLDPTHSFLATNGY